MNNKLKLISATYIGGYNDTTVFNTLIKYNEKDYNIYLEKNDHDMQEPPNSWNIITDLHLTKEEKDFLVDIIASNTPIHRSDASPKMYNKDFTNVYEKESSTENKQSIEIEEQYNFNY